MSNWINIVELEQTWYNKLKEMFDKVYINNAPQAFVEQTLNYAVVSIGNSISNTGAYKESYGYIYMYTRNKESVVQDSYRIEEIVNDVLALFPLTTDLFSAISPSIGYGTKEGEYTMAMVRFRIIINQ